MDALSYFALAIIFFVILTLAYGMIAIHDIPYLIAEKRHHPHAEAIHAAGWVSLFTLHAIWPFLWIWATAYHPEHGYGGSPATTADLTREDEKITALEKRLAALESNSPSAPASDSPTNGPTPTA